MMRQEDQEEHLKTIRGLVEKRRACIAAADLADLELGRELEVHCQKFSVSMEELSEDLGFRRSTLDELRTLTEGANTALSADGTVPSISHWGIPDMAKRYGPVSRVIGHVSSAEHVKVGETVCYADLMSASGVGWLIQATVGSFGGVGGWCRNLAGLAV